MKYNIAYQHLSTVDVDDDPTPMTITGTHALVERFYSMKRLGVGRSMPEVGAGGVPGNRGTSTYSLLGSRKTKRFSTTKKQKAIIYRVKQSRVLPQKNLKSKEEQSRILQTQTEKSECASPETKQRINLPHEGEAMYGLWHTVQPMGNAI